MINQFRSRSQNFLGKCVNNVSISSESRLPLFFTLVRNNVGTWTQRVLRKDSAVISRFDAGLRFHYQTPTLVVITSISLGLGQEILTGLTGFLLHHLDEVSWCQLLLLDWMKPGNAVWSYCLITTVSHVCPLPCVSWLFPGCSQFASLSAQPLVI